MLCYSRKYSLGGAYRKILQIPSNLSWKIMHYKERHSDLIMCDLEEMRNSSPPKDEPGIVLSLIGKLKKLMQYNM